MTNNICSSCQKEIPAGAKFCANCGAKIGKSDTSSKKVISGKSHGKDIIVIVGILFIISVGYFFLRDNPNPKITQGSTKISGHENVEGMGQAMGMLGNLPEDFDALISMGNQFMDEGNYPVATECYKRALAINPESSDVRVDYGACLHGMGLPKRALEEFQAVLNKHPDHNIAHFNIGIVFSEINKTDSAIVYWKKYLEIDPNGIVATKAAQLINQYSGE